MANVGDKSDRVVTWNRSRNGWPDASITMHAISIVSKGWPRGGAILVSSRIDFRIIGDDDDEDNSTPTSAITGSIIDFTLIRGPRWTGLILSRRIRLPIISRLSSNDVYPLVERPIISLNFRENRNFEILLDDFLNTMCPVNWASRSFYVYAFTDSWNLNFKF